MLGTIDEQIIYNIPRVPSAKLNFGWEIPAARPRILPRISGEPCGALLDAQAFEEPVRE
jgi:hypothetical protein